MDSAKVTVNTSHCAIRVHDMFHQMTTKQLQQQLQLQLVQPHGSNPFRRILHEAPPPQDDDDDYDKEEEEEEEEQPEQDPQPTDDLDLDLLMAPTLTSKVVVRPVPSCGAYSSAGPKTSHASKGLQPQRTFLDHCKRLLQLLTFKEKVARIKATNNDKQARKNAFYRFNWLKLRMVVTPPVQLLHEHKMGRRVMVSGLSVPFTKQMHQRFQKKLTRKMLVRIPEDVVLYR